MEVLANQTNTVKTSLIALKASGADGFEGLLRLALTKLSGIPFRLASSGLQGGLDGDAAFARDAVSFEAKRYDGKLGRNEVLIKIRDLVRNNRSADRLWVLGATTDVGAQLGEQIRVDGDAQAVSTLILDWTPGPLPLLAVAVVHAGPEAIAFIEEHADPKQDRKALEAAFGEIEGHPTFKNTLDDLKAELNVTKLSTARAVKQNTGWRRSTFADKNTAMERLGQALTVGDDTGPPDIRTGLRAAVLSAVSPEQGVALIGEEGDGKSWLAAEICRDHPGLTLFLSAERFDRVEATHLKEFLIEQLIQQTGDVPTEALTERWRHRLDAWETTPPAHPLLVVVDGLNQRPQTRWDRLLNALYARLRAICGHLIITVRPRYWQQRVLLGLTHKLKMIPVPAWTALERDALLSHQGIAPEWLDAQTRATLCNPRLLGIAIRTLPSDTPNIWKGLTRDRLLFEHLRLTQAENFESETFDVLTNRLSDHARQVLERVQSSATEPPQRFFRESEAVMECRFFRMLDGPGVIYELRDEGLTLALGYAVVDQLWQAHHSGHHLSERVAQLINPIQAMDRAVDVVFDALMICALGDDRFHDSILAALLDAFANLQNVDEGRFEELTEFLIARPMAVFASLKVFCLERGKRINFDWFRASAFTVAETEQGRAAADRAIHDWLHCYNADALDQTSRYPNRSAEEDAKRFQLRGNEIDLALTAMSPFERGVLNRMTKLTGDTDRLYELALQLLAGCCLAPFAESFIAFGLGLALDRDTHRSRKGFRQLATFNRADRDAARGAFRAAIVPLQAPETSQAGQWTAVRMLLATGDEGDAVQGSQLAEELRKDMPPFPVFEKSWREDPVADPAAQPPNNLTALATGFQELDEDNLFVSMSVTAEDHNFRDRLPLICRFAPELAVEKGRAILSGLLTRKAMPLRQLIFNAHHLAPLMTRELAVQIGSRFADPHLLDTLPENEREILRSRAFEFVASHLTAQEQLSALQSGHFGQSVLIDIVPSLKFQPANAIESALSAALKAENEQAAFKALVAAIYGRTPATRTLEELIQQCCSARASILRAAGFELAAFHKIASIRNAHVKNGWTAQDAEEHTHEAWFGAQLLIDAAELGEIAVDDMLTRIDRRAWFKAVEQFGRPVAKSLFDALLGQIENVRGQSPTIDSPAVDLVLTPSKGLPYPLLSISESDRGAPRFGPEPSLGDLFRNDDDFDASQRQLHSIATAFFDGLNGTSLRELLCETSIGELRLLVEASSDNLSKLGALLESVTGPNFVWVRQIALATATLISGENPDRAIAFLRRACSAEGFLTIEYGDGLTSEHAAVWSCADTKAMRGFWRERLLSSANNAILANEVLAAERFGAAVFIQDLVGELGQSPSTLDQTYGLVIAGYSVQCAHHANFIDAHIDYKGLTGDAARVARHASEQQAWAKSWSTAVWDSDTAEELFARQTIAMTCIDARTPADSPSTSPWSIYEPLFQRLRKSAVKTRAKDRTKHLLGMEAPAPLFPKAVALRKAALKN